MKIQITEKPHSQTMDNQPFEIVETKGRGHPDSICDSLVDEVASDLVDLYLKKAGKICHFNVDKALLRGGKSSPVFGGGEVDEPMEIYIAGRATDFIDGKDLELDKVVENACRRWFVENMSHIDFDAHISLKSLIRPGSADLSYIFQKQDLGPLAGDTSFGVGFAPLSQTERIVSTLSEHISNPRFLKMHPEYGEDVKIMAVRNDNEVDITVACAFISTHVRSLSDYCDAKDQLAKHLYKLVDDHQLSCRIHINTGDDYSMEKVYLTVTGTSAECGDDGQVGRGNRVNGLITPYRPMSLEAASGKNPVSHVGRIYNYWSRDLCQEIVDQFDLIGCECYVVSQIGSPVSRPQLVDLRITTEIGSGLDINKKQGIESFATGYLRKTLYERN